MGGANRGKPQRPAAHASTLYAEDPQIKIKWRIFNLMEYGKTKSLVQTLLLLLAIVSLVGCVKPIPPENMIPTGLGEGYIIYEGPLYKAISVSDVGGGQETNPMQYSTIGNPELEKAIIKALATNNYYATSSDNSKYNLSVFLVEIDIPMGGFTATVTTFVRYKLTEYKSQKVLLDEIIKTTETKTVSDVFTGFVRVRVAQEESMKSNIAKFIKILFSLNKKS